MTIQSARSSPAYACQDWMMVLGGGPPEYSFDILAGSPSSGKTTLTHQLIFSLATAERPAVYLTVLGEPPLK